MLYLIPPALSLAEHGLDNTAESVELILIERLAHAVSQGDIRGVYAELPPIRIPDFRVSVAGW